MAYIGTGIDPITGLPYSTGVGYVDPLVGGTGYVTTTYTDPLVGGGYVVGGAPIVGGTTYVETTTTYGTGIDPVTGLPIGGGVYTTF